ncbi:camphor resistance protein CrcB [Geodermatophilus pulveris]|uniref:Fluoride-specific ion channel FluC n=1 Tax=Geodermatophilus pulveris TaxID=1564159 RepID=A0A239FTH0_9ACTN|nr:CrcB family protein [Geodermatophilus pulveris]SNS60287.1 camphor resistance protein CrcB [Geodermatophilus pulveris]
MTPLLVVAGALAGAPLRLLATRLAARAGRDTAWGTLAVNVAGSALLGVVLGAAGTPPAVVALVGTGFCGTLTTFSTASADVLRMVEQRQLARGLGHLLGTAVLGVAAAALGYLLAAG